jgi:DNA-binding transcriptional ArsR family regulator
MSASDASDFAEVSDGSECYIEPMSEVLEWPRWRRWSAIRRANMLCALSDGRALTAGELAYAAMVSPQTASGHLARHADASLIVGKQQGRHRYYALSGPHVAAMLESILAVAATSPPRQRPIRIDDMREARMCYDHIAGRLGVALADGLRERSYIELGNDGGALTRHQAKPSCDIGIDLDAARRSRRAFCRPCIDWSGRRLHLAGAVGSALADRLLALRWIARQRYGRALVVTAEGRDQLAQRLGVALPDRDRRTAESGRAPALPR